MELSGNIEAYEGVSWYKVGATGDSWEKPSSCGGHKWADDGNIRTAWYCSALLKAECSSLCWPDAKEAQAYCISWQGVLITLKSPAACRQQLALFDHVMPVCWLHYLNYLKTTKGLDICIECFSLCCAAVKYLSIHTFIFNLIFFLFFCRHAITWHDVTFHQKFVKP